MSFSFWQSYREVWYHFIRILCFKLEFSLWKLLGSSLCPMCSESSQWLDLVLPSFVLGTQWTFWSGNSCPSVPGDFHKLFFDNFLLPPLCFCYSFFGMLFVSVVVVLHCCLFSISLSFSFIFCRNLNLIFQNFFTV